MGIFKEINCASCGKKTNILTRTKLHDGHYLCGECLSKIPSHMKDSVKKHYDLENYRGFLDYKDYSDRELRPQFHETQSYYSVHIDTESRLLYLGYDINDKTIFYHFHNVEEFNLIFNAEEYKEGMLGDKVKGELLLVLKVNTPYFYHEEILDYSAKARAKKKLLSNKVEYENPRGMDEFLLYFQAAWRASLEAAYSQEQYGDHYESSAESELSQAMALFMIDSIEDLTVEQIRAQRNRLIKAFHPDKGSAGDTAYAQKINSAYELLKEYIS